MGMFIKATILTTGLGLALAAVAPAHAVTGHFVSSNGADKCAAFTPGITNTVRNRVSGTPNVGASPIAVACVFELDEVSGGGSVNVSNVAIALRNDSAVAVDVNCTLLPGDYDGFGTAVTKVVSLSASGGSGSANFNGSWDVFGIGVNCTLPSEVTIWQTIVEYEDDRT